MTRSTYRLSTYGTTDGPKPCPISPVCNDTGACRPHENKTQTQDKRQSGMRVNRIPIWNTNPIGWPISSWSLPSWLADANKFITVLSYINMGPCCETMWHMTTHKQLLHTGLLLPSTMTQLKVFRRSVIIITNADVFVEIFVKLIVYLCTLVYNSRCVIKLIWTSCHFDQTFL